jgi:hypothetical protein
MNGVEDFAQAARVDLQRVVMDGYLQDTYTVALKRLVENNLSTE